MLKKLMLIVLLSFALAFILGRLSVTNKRNPVTADRPAIVDVHPENESTESIIVTPDLPDTNRVIVVPLETNRFDRSIERGMKADELERGLRVKQAIEIVKP